jgi:hypothetical protein
MARIEEIFASALLDISRGMKYFCVVKYNDQEGVWEEMMVCCKISQSSSSGTEEEHEKHNSECPVCVLNSSVVPCEFQSVILLLRDRLLLCD